MLKISTSIIAIAAVLLCMSVVASCAGASAVTLVEKGQAKCTIIAPADDKAISPAVADLVSCLKKMSGADVPVVSDPAKASGAKIWVGVRPPNFAAPQGVNLADAKQFWPDGYLLMSGNGGVVMLSPRPEGVANAIYALLEDHLGCHWFTPGDIGEYIPRHDTVTVDIANGFEVIKPTFELRAPWYNGNAMPYKDNAEETAAMTKWYMRNRHGGIRGYAAQEWSIIFPKALQEQEPEIQAMINGKREPRGAEGQVCMSSPRAVEIATQYFVSVFNSNPELDYYTFSSNDNGNYCQCPQCMASGANDAERLMVFSNKVADSVAKASPGKGIAILAYYSSTAEPPPTLSYGAPNLYPVICSFSMEQVKPFTDPNPQSSTYRARVDKWMKILPRAWSYDYDGWYPGPWTLFHQLEINEDYHRSIGFSGIMSEYLDRNVGTDVYMWLTQRIAWDGSKRVDDLLDEFYPEYFGAAAADMRAVYEGFETQMQSVGGSGEVSDVPRLYPVATVDAALARIAQAKQKVAADPVIVARIERDENCLQLTKLFVNFYAASGKVRHGDASAKPEAHAAGQAYMDLFTSLKGTLTVGGTGSLFVQATTQALDDPGTYFDKPGPFAYQDSLDDGGKCYQAKEKNGFFVSTYGLYVAANAAGSIVYDVRAAGSLKFKDAHLANMYMYLTPPESGHNGVDISLDGGQTWQPAYADVSWQGGTTQPDLTPLVGGSSEFLLRFWVQNNTAQEILGMDNWGIAGTIE